jgi:hypothetical protein
LRPFEPVRPTLVSGLQRQRETMPSSLVLQKGEIEMSEAGLTETSATRPWPAEQVERWAIERLTPYADNARLHSEADIDKLADSLRRFGWTNPVLVDENGVQICGHGRVRAATKLGLSWVPVMVARGWSEEEKRAYR